MESVHSIKNQYLGINAHLHSFWQAEHKWNRFHNVYIAELVILFKAQLRPLGYTAEIEDSLQIRRLGDDVPRRAKGDVIVYDTLPHRNAAPPSHVNMAEVTVAELIEEEDTEYPYSAIAIYERKSGVGDEEVVAWIELLSPTNKGNTLDANAYLGKRRVLLDQGIVFVELDYLHETPPTFPRLFDYSREERQHPDAHPYRIAVLDPRPDVKTGPGKVEAFDVDMSIPTMTIPLNAGDRVDFDFGAAYRKTFEEMLYGLEDAVDYSQLPLNFDRYNQADQARILARMLSVLRAAQGGKNLEDGPFLVEPMTVEEGLSRLKGLTT